jgi:hypothetical protein
MPDVRRQRSDPSVPQGIRDGRRIFGTRITEGFTVGDFYFHGRNFFSHGRKFLFPQQENIFSRQENIFSRQENIFSTAGKYFFHGREFFSHGREFLGVGIQFYTLFLRIIIPSHVLDISSNQQEEMKGETDIAL